MNPRYFAMDTAFYHSFGVYDFDVRCEMLANLGYDATYLSLFDEEEWRDVPRLVNVKSRFGLDVAAVYLPLDIAETDDTGQNGRALRLLETLEGCDRLEVCVLSSDQALARSDPAGDAAARRWLERLLAVAEDRGITILLYPHFNLWLERLEDAVRLCRALNHPALGIVFCGFHWYVVDGGSALVERLTEAAPYLRSANLCGSRRYGARPGMPATIEPLDSGELDNFAVLAALRGVGYTGMVGVQGYSDGGDAFAKLRRSLAALKDLEARVVAHPEWAHLRPILKPSEPS